MFLLLGSIKAQNFTQFSFSHKLGNYYNPSLIALDGHTKAKLLHRSQWVNYNYTTEVNPRPLTQLVTLEHPISFFSKSISSEKNEALGLSILNDNIGIVNQINLQLALAKKIKLSETKGIGFGLSLGLLSQRIKVSDFTSVESNDPTIQELINSNTLIEPSLSAGFQYYGSKNNFGLAFNNLLSSDTKGYILSQKTLFFNFKTHFILSPTLELFPLINLISDFKNHSYIIGVNSRITILQTYLDFNLLARQAVSQSQKNVWSFGNNDVIVQLGFPEIPQLPIGLYYSFDYVSLGVAAKSNVSHELMLSYQLGKKKKYEGKELFSPRYKYN